MIKKKIVFLVLLLIFFAASWSLFRPEFFHIHDFTHGARIAEMYNALQDGHFPVRWSENFGYGYGMPLFEFYAPLPYYVGAFLYSLGFSLINSIKMLFIIPTVVTVLGSYLLGKKLFGKTWGLVVSAAITLAPYRAMNLFVRGAVAEIWGIMVLPMVILGIIYVVKEKKNGWILLLVSLVILLLSHNLTSLIFIPVSVVLGAVYLLVDFKSKKLNWPKFWRKSFIFTGIYLLAILISSFYIIPALAEKDFTRLESAILTEYFEYELHFLSFRQFFQENWKYGGSSWGPYDDISFYLGTGQLVAFGFSLFIFIKHLLKNLNSKNFLSKFDKKTLNYLLFLFLFFVSIFMTMYRSMFIWDSLEILSFIQFPWRWLSSAIIFLGIIIGFSSIFIRGKFKKKIFAIIFLTMIISINWKYFQPEKFISNAADKYYMDDTGIRTDMSKTLPDFIPAQMKDKTFDLVVPVDVVLGCQLLRSDLGCLDKFSKEPEVIINKTQKKLAKIDLLDSRQVEFAVADFPGWQVSVDGKEIDHKSGEYGTIVFDVDKGSHLIKLDFKNTNVRNFADALSLTGLGIFSIALFWYYRKSK